MFSSTKTLFLLAGLLILIVSVSLSALRLRQNHPRAGILSVLLTLAACALITVGIVSIAFPILAGGGPLERFAIPITVVGAVAITLAGIVLFVVERRREGFDPTASPGLLYAGAGAFVLVAVLLVPNLPAQLSVARANGSRAAGVPTVSAPTRAVRQALLPTVTLTPSLTPTAPPTLTPTPIESPTDLFTPIAYPSSDVSTATDCTVTAQTMLILRGDPSVQRQGIGKIFAGSLLSVTGQSADKKWWRVINSDGTTSVEGWVSADFVTPGPTCTGESIPVIGPTLTPSRTPRATRTPLQSATPNASITGTTVSPVTPTLQAGQAASCVLMTTTSVSLRPDPSRLKPPIAQIPERVALITDGKSVDGYWWHVTYTVDGTTKEGWVGAGAVIAAANCAEVPSLAATM